MAVTADKNPPESKSYSERIVDFSGGLNTTISGSLLNSNEAQVAADLSLEQKGTLRPRSGRVKRYATPFATTPVTGLGAYYKNDGTSRILVASGECLYSDAPHMSTKWTTKADWEQTNTELLGYSSTTEVEGSVTSRKQLLGLSARCDDVSLWTALDSTISLKSDDSPYADGDALEVLISTGKTSGYAYKTPALGIDTTKYAVLTGYVKNSDATSGVRLVGLTISNNVSKSSAYITATAWTRVILKLAPADLLNITSVGVQVTGTAGKCGYFTGLYLKYITAEEYADTEYAPPELTYYEAFQQSYECNDNAEFIAGTMTAVFPIDAGGIELTVEIGEMYVECNTKEAFDYGTYTNTSATESLGSVVLARQA